MALPAAPAARGTVAERLKLSSALLANPYISCRGQLCVLRASYDTEGETRAAPDAFAGERPTAARWRPRHH